MKKIVLLAFVSLLLLMMTIVCPSDVLAWSNGGYSDDPSNPDYGTHDWIAEHALDWLPKEEKRYIVDNLAAYLYGTELPDNGVAPDGIGDTTKHHIYYWSNESLQDDVSAVRASEEYNNTLNFLRLGDLANASKTAGIMSHYIVDVTVFGHVMGADTDWGGEEHHSDYETYVNQRTSSYDAEFNVYLSFDGELTLISAYDAAKELAYDTTFDVDGDLTCVWMDQNYNWSDPVFKNRCRESLNLAVNYLTDVLHTLYSEAVSVHNIDTERSYLTIQEAINAPETSDGHTILVAAGTYVENVVVNKSISLVGENRDTTIVDGDRIGNVIHITADNVNITGLTMQNSGPGCGLYIDHSSRNNISHNLVTNNDVGIHLRYSSNSIITCNIVSHNKNHGILVDHSDSNVLIHNNVSNSAEGIGIVSDSCIVVDNTVLSNDVYGIWISFSTNNTVSSNVASNNGIGIWVRRSRNNTFAGNTISNNDYGIDLVDYSDKNTLTNNTVSNNTLYGIYIDNSIDNVIYYNDFINNSMQVYSPNSG